jgi:hypothetical protein
MTRWLAWLLLDRRYGLRDGRYAVQLYWWSTWRPVRLVKHVAELHMTDEMLNQLLPKPPPTQTGAPTAPNVD